MKILKKAWISYIFFIQVFFTNFLYSEEIAHPTYSQFLNKFPDGYPQFSGIGNPKSVGAFKMYLEELGYMTFDHKGNSIGFKYFVSEGENSFSDKKNISSGSQSNAQDSTEFQINNDQTNSEVLTKNYSKNILISKWVGEINSKIKDFIIYPKISKDRNQSGRVLISISLRANGNILDVKLENSSGFLSLDKATVNSIKRIQSFNPSPFKSDNKIHTFILPINYVLED